MEKLKIAILFLIVIIGFQLFTNNVKNSDYLKNVDIKPFSVPKQEPLSYDDRGLVFHKKFKQYRSTIRPLYKYKVYAKIYSKKRYFEGYDPAPAPYDLALAWDGLEKEEVINSIKVQQYGRWVHWQLKPNCPYNTSGVYARLANTHTIPATDAIFKGLQKLRKHDDVYLEGYLVEYETTDGHKKYQGASSTSRTDEGANSCEVMYVTKLISKYGIYQ